MKFLALGLALILAACTHDQVSPSTETKTVKATSTVTATSTSTGTSTSVSVGVCPKVLPAGCPEPGVYQALDIAGPVSQKLLDAAKCAGIHTIIRYYDWPGAETIKGKIPLAGEMALIKKNGFKVLFVFQHSNNKFSTFQSADRPAQDAAAILKLAKQFGQPEGSGIYVGVDGDFYSASELATVRGYFSKLAPKLREAGFKVGMYGSGANCTSLQGAKLVDLPCWIAASSWGWSGTKAALAAGNYGLKQKVNQSCVGHGLDYNVINPKYKDVIGQWSIP